MPTLRFNARRIAALRPVGTAQTDYWDASLPGFGLRVSPRRAVWTLYYRHKGRKRRLTIGKYPDLSLDAAKKKAKPLLHEIALGADPSAEKLAERATHADTVQALVELYEPLAERKKSWPEERRILHNEILPAWGDRLVREIARRDIRTLVETKALTAPVMANRILAGVSRLLTFALDREWIEANPAQRIRKPGEETSRDRVLSWDELRLLWAALHETEAEDDQGEPVNRLTPTLNDAFVTLLLTAQRLGEVCRMKWADVDMTAGWWTIPASDTKNGAEHRVPLTAPVLAILKARKAAAAERLAKQKKGPKLEPVYVFANRRGTRSVAARAKRAASFLSAGLPFAFRAHDLRRTASTRMAEAKVPREHIAHVLNHRSVTRSTVTAIYDRYERDREKLAALRTWARVLEKAVKAEAEQSASLIPFTRA